LFCFISINCEKNDEIVSPKIEPDKADIIAQKLQKYIDEFHPVMAAAYIFNYQQNDWINDNNGESCGDYEIESPFIKVCGVYYNLEYLVKYEPGHTLKLYFIY
jgi:hypothetical protein